MNLQIINDCAGTDHGLPTAGTDPGRRYKLARLGSFGRVYSNSIIRLKMLVRLIC